MTRYEAKALARQAAVLNGKVTEEEQRSLQLEKWVLDAILAAHLGGYNEGFDAGLSLGEQP